MMFLDHAAALQQIADFAAASDRCLLAMTSWGAGAAERFLERRRPARIICNLAIGGADPAEIERLIASGADVMQADDLHAQVYLFDDAVILGSSVAGFDPLPFQGSGGPRRREANVLIRDPSVIAAVEAWFDTLETRAITQTDLAQARDAWTNRRRAADASTRDPSLLTRLQSEIGFFEDKPAWLVLTSDKRSLRAEAFVEALQASENPRLGAYETVPGLPPEGQLFGLRIDGDDIEHDGYWERTRQVRDRNLDGGVLHLVLRRDDILGLVWNQSEKPQWKGVVDLVLQSRYWNDELGCAAVPLTQVSALVQAASAASPKQA